MRTLPTIKLTVDRRECRALVDTGCTDTLVYAGVCRSWKPRRLNMTTVNGGTLHCTGTAQVTVRHQGRNVTLVALVVPDRPLGMDMVLGMTGIMALGGVSVRTSADVQFCAAATTAAVELAVSPAVAVAPVAPAATAERAAAAAAAAEPAAAVEPTAAVPMAVAAVASAAMVAPVAVAAAPVEPAAVAAPAAATITAAETAPVGKVSAADVRPRDVSVDAADFTAEFSAERGEWTVAWKWAKGDGPGPLRNVIAQYAVPEAARSAYYEELELWIREGWLQPYDERVDGAARGLIPLMAVVQPNQDKVRPVLDYRELNGHIAAHTADADVCAEQLRRWRRHGSSVAVVDLRKAYLQLRLDRRLWPYQTVKVRGQRYSLTRVGFGLNCAPLIMKAVVRAILEQDETVGRGVLPFVDDLLVDEDVISAERVAEHFSRYGLQCKPPQRAAAGARLLGLRVKASAGELLWRRDNLVGAPPETLTRRALFAWCGQLVSHLPVAGWLRPAAAWLKRRVNALTQGWDDPTTDPELRAQVSHVAERVACGDPAHGPWRLKGDKLVVWTDASSVASGVVLEDPEGGVVEDASWLRPEPKAAMHINMAELDAALSGVNMAIAWGIREIDLRTDSATVRKWIGDALSGRSRLRTKAHGEMLIRRRVDVIRELVTEFQLSMTVTLVRSEHNPADTLTRVPKEWLRADRPEKGPPPLMVAAAATADRQTDHDAAKIRAVHENIGHQGVRRTLWYLRRDGHQWATKKAVRSVIQQCDVCQSIDPAPTRWRHGSLSVPLAWDRLAIDVTHYRGQSYLTVVDCGPSRYGVWRQLRRSDATEITRHLETIFLEHGAPAELLLDNATEFRGRRMQAFAARWGLTLRFRAAHEAGGNGIVERHHRTIKVMSARQGCTIAESVHRYNMTPRDGQRAESAPAAGLFQRVGRDLPVSTAEYQPAVVPPAEPRGERGNGFRVGDLVWIRRRGPPTRCTDVSRPGTVTRVVSEQLVEVDGIPWHVRCVRRRRSSDQAPRDDAHGDGDADPAPLLGSPSSDDDPVLPLSSPETDEVWHDAESGGGEQVGSPPVEPSEPALDTAPIQTAPDITPERGASEFRDSTRARQPPDWYGTVVPNDFR